VIKQRSPAQPIVMARSFAPGACTALRTAVIIKSVVEIQSGPRCVHSLYHDIMVVEKLPGRSNGSTRGTTNLCVTDYTVRVGDEGNVVSKVVSREVLHPRAIHE
jgi:hypothetical protein